MKVILYIVGRYKFNTIVMLFCAILPQSFSSINLFSKLKLLVKRFHQVFIKKGRILGMLTGFFLMIALNNCPFKLANTKFPDSPHTLSNVLNLLSLVLLSQSPAVPSILLKERQEGHSLGTWAFLTKKSLSR